MASEGEMAAALRPLADCEQVFDRIVRRFARNALPGVKVVSDVADLAEMDLDAVYVATLPASHHPVVRTVYEGGIARHVFVEKSLASSHSEAVDMCRLAEAHGGVSVVGFQKRFGGMFRKTKELLDEGTLGDVTSFDAYAYSSDFAEASADFGTSRNNSSTEPAPIAASISRRLASLMGR